MSNDGVHVVFGAGQVGNSLIEQLATSGHSVRAVSRHRPRNAIDGVEWRVADAADPVASVAAAAGASVVYQCLGAPYTKWPELFPPLQHGVLAAAEAAGALLVSLENVYAYGPTGGTPMTEDHPLAATTVKGRTRAAMTRELLAATESGRVRIAIGRASDFFGAGVTESALGERVFANALAGKRADFIGDPGLAHTYSYVPDIATGLMTLGTNERAIGEVWHLPGPETVTTTALLQLVASEVGHPVGIRSVPKLALSALGLVNPMMRGLAEMRYQFDEPFVLDTTKYENMFGAAGAALSRAVADTVTWFRTRIEGESKIRQQ
jgi:nucleoside-diphosphate-sugar epimerase